MTMTCRCSALRGTTLLSGPVHSGTPGHVSPWPSPSNTSSVWCTANTLNPVTGQYSSRCPPNSIEKDSEAAVRARHHQSKTAKDTGGRPIHFQRWPRRRRDQQAPSLLQAWLKKRMALKKAKIIRKIWRKVKCRRLIELKKTEKENGFYCKL